MKLHRKQYCPIHSSLFCCGGEQSRRHALSGSAFSASKIRITEGDTENSAHPWKYGNCSTARLWNRAGECALPHELFTDYHDCGPPH
jgi:hypothetical protein